MTDFKLTEITKQFKGYQSTNDLTSLPDCYLVPPSQNVLYADDGTIGVREGYSLDGQSNAALYPIQSAYDWNTSTGVERNLRFWNGNLQVRIAGTGVETASLPGDETITNGSFTGNATSWGTSPTVEALPGEGWAYNSNNVIHTAGAGNDTSLYQNTFHTPGASYSCSISVGGTVGTVTLWVGDATTGSLQDIAAGAGTVTGTITAIDGTIGVHVQPSEDFDGTIDNVSVKELLNNISSLGDGEEYWYTIDTSLTDASTPRFAEFWNTTEKEDVILFVDGTANIFEWSGGITTFASATATTITKQGTTTWAQDRFLTSNTPSGSVTSARSVTINGTVYTYTGGEGTTTLTGVSPNPTSAGYAMGTVITQSVRTISFGASNFTRPSAFAATDVMDLIAVLNNQVYLGYTKSRVFFVSKVNNLVDYSQSSPRLPAEGDTITLDGALVGFIAQEDNAATGTSSVMYCSAGKDYWYQVLFQKSADLTKETEVIRRLKTAPRQAAQSQELITKVGNEIVFVSNEPALMSLGRVENVETPQVRNISNPVKTEFDGYDFSNGSLKYHRTLLYLSLPAEGLVHPRNIKDGFWEAPQVLPSRFVAIIGGEAYMHSSQVPETYKLFDGANDNGNPIYAKAYFNYQNFGDRANYKNFNEAFTEGYISSNTLLTLVLKYDFGGFRTIKNFDIEGDDSAILFQTFADNSLGKYPLGNQGLGSITDTVDDLGKFRVIHKTNPDNFFELQTGYESNDIDMRWKLLCYGPNISRSDAQPNLLKK